MPLQPDQRPQPAQYEQPKSILYIPAHKESFIAKASQRGADVIALDLEDSVPTELKAQAREQLLPLCQQYLAQKKIWVRVNRPWTLLLKDLEKIVDRQVSAIIVPKTDNAARIHFIDEALTEIEQQKGLPIGHTSIIGFIESIDGMYNAREIAHASPRLIGLGMGTEDFALTMGMQNTPSTLYGPCQQLVMAARSAHIQPIGLVGSMAEFRDLELYQQQLEKGFELGFSAAFCIHPNQVVLVNQIYHPDQPLIDWAQRILTGWQHAQEAGEAVFELDGKMVDWPVVAKAEKILGQ